MAPIIERPPASAMDCHSTMAVKGERAGQVARESAMGTGHARDTARAARKYDAQTTGS